MDGSRVIIFDKALESRVRDCLDPDEMTPELLNLLRVMIPIHEHAFHGGGGMTKGKLLALASEAWDTGLHQRRVSHMEVEGMINNAYGVVLNFACYLAMHGESEGYLPSGRTYEEWQDRSDILNGASAVVFS